MSPIDNILARLEKVRQRQMGQWSALCPAHEDKTPSLSVREASDGAVLLHCFGGCTSYEVAASIGVEMHELFPPTERPANAPQRTPTLLTTGQALELLAEEANLVAILISDACDGKAISPEDRDRGLQAACRISWLRQESMGGSHDQSR